MSQVIIYTEPSGIVAVIMPAPESPLSLKEIGDKDVPTGLPYWIVSQSDLPIAPQESWVLTNMPEPDGVGQ